MVKRKTRKNKSKKKRHIITRKNKRKATHLKAWQYSYTEPENLRWRRICWQCQRKTKHHGQSNLSKWCVHWMELQGNEKCYVVFHWGRICVNVGRIKGPKIYLYVFKIFKNEDQLADARVDWQHWCDQDVRYEERKMQNQTCRYEISLVMLKQIN